MPFSQAVRCGVCTCKLSLSYSGLRLALFGSLQVWWLVSDWMSTFDQSLYLLGLATLSTLANHQGLWATTGLEATLVSNELSQALPKSATSHHGRCLNCSAISTLFFEDLDHHSRT